MKIGLFGHGTIGVGVDRIASSIPGMEVRKILSLVVDEEMKGREASSVDEIVCDPEIDTVVEVMGGVEPAFTFIKRAMEAGKNVVTANKAVVAAHYEDLARIASEHGVAFRFTASVGGSIPWLVNLARATRVGSVEAIEGIMNGTTNFILNRMTNDGASFESALKEAQELGYAERDPSADIDALDVRRKLLISANVGFSVLLREEDLPTYGIRFVRPEDIAYAKDQNAVIKLVASASRTEGNGVSAFVMPSFVPADSLQAAVAANYNVISYTGSYSGTQSYIGEGAGRFPTAYNVVEDLMDIRDSFAVPYQCEFPPCAPENGNVMRRFYLRCGTRVTVTDRISFDEARKAADESLKNGQETFFAVLPE